jgi:hypothetical protein
VSTCAGGDCESEQGDSDGENFDTCGSEGDWQRHRGMGGRLRPGSGGRRDPDSPQQPDWEGHAFLGGSQSRRAQSRAGLGHLHGAPSGQGRHFPTGEHSVLPREQSPVPPHLPPAPPAKR